MTQRNDLTTQKNDFTVQKNDIDKSISSANSQKTFVLTQIEYINGKASGNLKELKKIFKEYTNKEFELKKLKEQTPVSYLSDGNAFLCFNEFGKLCAIADNYNNYISIEYDNKERISKVNDGKRAAVLKYNFYGQLASVTDYRGRRTTYKYSSTSASGNLRYVAYPDGNTLLFDYTYAGYWEEELFLIDSSADKTRTMLSYSYNKLSSIKNQSSVSAISDDGISAADASGVTPVTVSVTEISYCANECAITTDGKLKHYFMDILGNLVGGYSKLTDGTDEERLSYSYFDRVNNWRYSVKETGDPIALTLPRELQTFTSVREEVQTLATANPVVLTDRNLQTSITSAKVQTSVTENQDRLPDRDLQIGRIQTFASSDELRSFLSEQNPQGAVSVKSLQLSALPEKFKKDYPAFVLKKELLISSTVPVASLPAGKTEFVFSAYAAAENAPVTDMRFGTAFRPLPTGGSDQKFEIIAEVNYRGKPVQTFVASFDYKNKGKQFCALPVTLDKSSLANLQSIVLKHVYTGSGTAAFTDFRFAPCEWEYKTFDQFKNVSYSETGTVLLNSSRANAYDKAFVNYSYDNEHRLIQRRLTNTTSVGSGNTVNYAVSKYYYNDYGSIARVENYIEGEEGSTGIVVEETVYNEKGNVIKNITYNTLDSTAKSYSENEYSENGQLKTKIDATGENNTAIEYAPDTDDVRTIINPDGGKFSYGRDYAKSVVTGITQSTEEGESNSIETKYTCGVVTRLKSGLNTVNYEYDANRRKTKVLLNGEERVKYAYAENVLSDKININDIEFGGVISDKVTAALKGGASPEIVTEAITDKRDNLIFTSIDGNVQFANRYNSHNSLINSVDNITGSTLAVTYDDVNKRTANSSRTAGTKSGYEYLDAVSESYGYNNLGALSERTVSVNGTVVQTYLHTYKNNAARSLDSITLPNNLLYKPQTDANGRNTGKLLADLNGNNRFGEYINYRKVGDHATDMVSSIRYGEVKNGRYSIGSGLDYKYDGRGNITEIWKNGKLAITYTYDKLQRLVREDNKLRGKSWFCSYDNNGNILSKQEADYTAKPAKEITEYNYEKLYSYDGDRLTDCGGESFVYDGFGNPVTYRSKALTWQQCKLVDFNGITFAYDGYGKRVKKGDTVYTYDLGGKLLCQGDRKLTLEFIYDESGLSGVKHRDRQYVYRKNIQGDITHIFDIAGELIACYDYDAWGNHTVSDAEGNPINGAAHIGNLNPFRYRGYLYDTETKLYFLHNRYYDPETGRFISQDEVSYLDPSTINGLNLFAYCGNNPVMRIDETGCSWSSFWKSVGNVFKSIGLFIAGLVIAVVGAVIMIVGAALSLALLPLSSIPGVGTLGGMLSGVLFQVGASTMMYGGFMFASSWDKQIYADMDAIGWNPFNSNTDKVLSSEKVSFYKGMPVVRIDSGRAWSFGSIHLARGDNETDLKHEYGHAGQQMLMGPASYLFMVGIPSMAELGPWDYYSKPWETTADMFGGVPADSMAGSRDGSRNSDDVSRAKGYLAISILFGPFASFYLA
ncbi:MAG: RHS repeat-associated core domain-containing protein [Endomicrobia bacterium]|nr:RHS repeat-associated core domain-containing protein [Endomicrobiia bacterium]